MKFQINIPQPCHENWNEMTVAKKGRFCNNCQKTVYDFTKSTDREILEKLKSNETLCGRFVHAQLNRELNVPKEKPTLWAVAASGLFVFFGTNDIYAQEKQKSVQTDVMQIDEARIMTDSINDKITISGIVVDNGGVLPGANIIAKGSTSGVQTDINGKFMITVSKTDTLVISFVGMADREISATDPIFANSKPNVSFIQLLQSWTGGISITRKRTFLGRIFLSVGNLFRSKYKKRF
jgi:hypothetical protein